MLISIQLQFLGKEGHQVRNSSAQEQQQTRIQPPIKARIPREPLAWGPMRLPLAYPNSIKLCLYTVKSFVGPIWVLFIFLNRVVHVSTPF